MKAQPAPLLHDPDVAPLDVPPTHVPVAAHQPQPAWLNVQLEHDEKAEHAAN